MDLEYNKEPINRKKFASQASEKVLAEMHKIARKEGRLFQVVLEEAMTSYIENKHNQKIRPQVLTAFRESLIKNRKLGELLAK